MSIRDMLAYEVRVPTSYFIDILVGGGKTIRAILVVIVVAFYVTYLRISVSRYFSFLGMGEFDEG